MILAEQRDDNTAPRAMDIEPYMGEVSHRLGQSLAAGMKSSTDSANQSDCARLAAVASSSLAPFAVASRWIHCEVRLPDVPAFAVAVDPEMEEATTRSYCRGEGAAVNERIVRLILGLLRPGDVLLDIGAYLGSIALPAAAAGCVVAAVEACPLAAGLLRDSAGKNGFTRMRVVRAVASDEAGTLQFVPCGPQGHVAKGEGSPPAVPVSAIRMDELAEELGLARVDVVKLDVEGWESNVLGGMERLLKQDPGPVLVYESDGPGLAGYLSPDPREMAEALESFGYRIYRLDGSDLVPVKATEMPTDASIDCLAIKQAPPAVEGWTVQNG